MNKYLALAASAIAAAAMTLPARAHDVQQGPIRIEQPWTRATPGGAKVAGGFLKITNTGTTPDRLVSATAEVSGVVEIHEMKMVDGVMKMRALGDGLVLAPGQTVELKPGGYHLMFMDLKAPVVQDKPVKARLVFEKAGAVEVAFTVAPVGAKSPGAKSSGAKSSGDGGHHHKH
jgi:copper(I)-binding protein